MLWTLVGVVRPLDARAAEPARGERGRPRRRGGGAEADAEAEAARECARLEERARQEQREARRAEAEAAKAAKDARRREAERRAAAAKAAAAEANRQMAKARDAAENPPAPVELGAEEVCELRQEPLPRCSSPATVAGAASVGAQCARSGGGGWARRLRRRLCG